MVKCGLQIGCPEPSMVTTSRALAANGLIQTRLDNLVELKSQCIKIGTPEGKIVMDTQLCTVELGSAEEKVNNTLKMSTCHGTEPCMRIVCWDTKCEFSIPTAYSIFCDPVGKSSTSGSSAEVTK
ncbi:hypothetical protein G6F33_014017 [Rhizopus arrhizus]|nr:hypothetical protein G6F33_014017 [Rhizopus arrhizus]